MIDPDEDRHIRGLWSAVLEPGDGVAGVLIAGVGAPEAWRITAAGDTAAAERAGVAAPRFRAGRERWLPRAAGAPAVWRDARRAGARLLIPSDPAWPLRLDGLGPHAPIALWVRGDPTVLAPEGPAVAVVGARAATGYGEHVTGELVAGLVAEGVTVVSGAAYGIDAAAHRGALAAGGRTAA
ncbi:DNA-processing protein DprA, partial [Microbacterium sp.]|uniref:DNA-processing protein DprA n=1 Tax=Microbacterium sp. TaxID=51671 RepID=UPI003A8B44D6